MAIIYFERERKNKERERGRRRDFRLIDKHVRKKTKIR